jgi:uncharacterized protein (TIGR03435 family)
VVFIAGVYSAPARAGSGATQNSSTPDRYDAATVKRCAEEENPTGARGAAGGTNATFSPGRFQVPCVTVEQLIYLAYASQGATPAEYLLNDGLGGPSNESKIRGGPAWVHSLREKYAIEATAAGATERTVLMGSMLRALLEDRFQLKIHREQESVDMFALTIAKGGVKMSPMKPGDCDDDESTPSDPDRPKCGSLNSGATGPNATWTFGGFPISALAGRLSSTVDLHVVDNTGLTDKYVMRLTFHPDDTTPGIKWPGQRDADTSVPAADNIFTALERQLGLKLEKTKAPRGFIVIDHVERPAPDSHRPAPRSFDSLIEYWYNLYHDKTY